MRLDGFADWFARVTPLEEIGALPLGSRPARRGLKLDSLDDLRAIPWVFSWAQTRVNLPGWYGLGSGLEAVGDVAWLQRAHAEWPLFTVMMENAEMSLAKTDRRIASRYLALGGRPELAGQILDEHSRTMRWVLAVTGHHRLRTCRCRRCVACAADASADGLRQLLNVTVNGVAAGLQNTG